MRRWPAWAVLFLVVQVAVPVWQLTRPRPARFGWQMYAGLPQASAFVAVGRDGSETAVSLEDFLLRPRDDLDLLRYLPAAICARTGAATVRYRRAPEEPPVDVPCRR